ncbi:hypothetical protein [Photobacterium leiognathi]|uniref:hypothetical protein n=1 Tax=Photobacterium leiognathi TaxID=553611 RepID=UPI002981763E|nr:hypothetical protein [Photobacterium leiognathi]
MATHNVINNTALANLFTTGAVSVGDTINLLLITPQIVSLVVSAVDFSQGKSADIVLLEDSNNNFGTIQKDSSNVIHIFKTADSSPVQLHEYHA